MTILDHEPVERFAPSCWRCEQRIATEWLDERSELEPVCATCKKLIQSDMRSVVSQIERARQ